MGIAWYLQEGAGDVGTMEWHRGDRWKCLNERNETSGRNQEEKRRSAFHQHNMVQSNNIRLRHDCDGCIRRRRHKATGGRGNHDSTCPGARIAEQTRQVATGQPATRRAWAVTRRTGSEHCPRDRCETDAWEHKSNWGWIPCTICMLCLCWLKEVFSSQ